MARRRRAEDDDEGPGDGGGADRSPAGASASADDGGAGVDRDDGGAQVHPAVFAANWRTVLAVDAAMGVAVAVAGIVLAVVWNVVAGGLLGSCGVAYVVAVARRGAQWAQMRRDAGL
jgi:hypothetical protein